MERKPDAIKSTRSAALWYAKQGWNIFPVWPMLGSICRCGKQDCKDKGKHPVAYINRKPIVPNGVKNATTDINQINEWWNLFPGWNIATSSHFRIDVDTKNNGLDNWRELLANNGGHGKTPICKTPSGGLHIYFKSGEDFGHTNQTGDLPGGIDVRGDGSGYTLLPPSNHVDGVYTWGETSHPKSIQITTAPAWLIELVGKDKENITLSEFEDVDIPNIEDLQTGQLVKALLANDRSRIDECVITSLIRAGLSDNEVRAIFINHPPTAKYSEKNGQGDKYLAYSIAKARKWLESRPAYEPLQDAV